MSAGLTPGQRKKLEDLGQTVKSNFKRLDESEIIGRIILTGRTIDNAITGYKLLRSENVIGKEFVTPGTEGVLERMIARNPNVALLIDRLECVPRKTTTIQGEPKTIALVTRRSQEGALIRPLSEILKALNLKSDF
jgi:hypothetical protein